MWGRAVRAAGPCVESGAEPRVFLAACVIGQFGYIELVGARVCVCAPVCTHVCAREKAHCKNISREHLSALTFNISELTL